MYLIKDSEKIQTDMYLVIIIFIVVEGSVIFRGKELEEKTEKQQMRINMLNKFNEQYNLLVETSRKKQHEFNNHINTLRGMSVVSDEQYKENQRMYIDTLSKNDRTIKILTYVEQPVLAGFLYKKVEEIMEKGINITIDLSVPANELCIDVIDCIEIIGILLDNAVEALQNNEETKKIDTSTKGFTAWIEDIQSGRGVYNSNNVDDTESISNRNDDRLYDKSRKSNTRRTAIQSNENQQIEGEISLKGLKDL